MVVLAAIALLVLSVIAFNKVLPGLLCVIALLVINYFTYTHSLVDLTVNLGNAVLITFELGLLILGSISFYRILENQGHFKDFATRLKSKYDQVDLLLFVTWFLCIFFEGIAGFGVPALLIVPLMLSLGYKPLSSIALVLSANTLSVCFGALGTPVKIGLSVATPHEPVIASLSSFLFFPFILMPLWLVTLASLLEPEKIKFKLKSVYKALFAGLIPALAIYFLAPYTLEFPSVLAGILGFVIYLVFRTGFRGFTSEFLYWYSFFKPYLFLVVVLFVARILIGYESVELKAGLRNVALYQPGMLLLIFCFLWIVFQQGQKKSTNTFIHTLKNSFQKSRITLVTIFLLVIMAGLLKSPVKEILLGSGLSLEQLEYVAPLAGVLGSFTTGSLTMSNLMLYEVFKTIFASSESLIVVSVLLHIGGALGNAISLQNIIMVDAVVSERTPLKKVIGYNFITVSIFIVFLLLLNFIY